MSQPVILFKAPTLSVQQFAEWDEQTAVAGARMLAGGQNIPLEATAAEVLVNYLQVIRAYFSSFPGSGKIMSTFYVRLALELKGLLQQSGRRVAQPEDISELIARLGCVSDWLQQYPQPSFAGG